MPDLEQCRAEHDASIDELLNEDPDWPIATVEVTTAPGEVPLYRLTLLLCEYCVTGAGGMCSSPGCALWIHSAPDVPITTDADGSLIRLAVASDA